MRRLAFIIVTHCLVVNALNLDYLDPTKLQTQSSAEVQQAAAVRVISKFFNNTKPENVVVTVDPELFKDNKDSFQLQKSSGKVLYITASSGVAAVWGFHYYLKKYCHGQIGWQVRRVALPEPLPDVQETVVANDRFRSFYNSAAASYSFAWWDADRWLQHVDWMALNGINIAYAPVAEEAAWTAIYRSIGMTQEEIDQHFSGPAYLAWLRWGNVHGLAGPLHDSWHEQQMYIQKTVMDYMNQLGMIPIFPAFNGHVPKAFSRIFLNSTFYPLGPWYSKRSKENCCNLFVDPNDPLFKFIGYMFLEIITRNSTTSHLYAAEPFIQINIKIADFRTLVADTAKSVYTTLEKFDSNAVWVVMNTMMIKEPWRWNDAAVEIFLTSVPNGRMLVMDLEAEQTTFYKRRQGYHGQPFVWCMMQSWAGRFGMYGSAKTVNTDIHKARNSLNSNMIGMGISSTEINVNDVMYELLMETAWRDGPVELDEWVGEYAARRYGCSATADAWRHLLHSVYSQPRRPLYGHTTINSKPSFDNVAESRTWFKRRDLFEAFKQLVFAPAECNSEGFDYDLVDVTRQALHYRAEQLYLHMKNSRALTYAVFHTAANQFMDVLYDMARILGSNDNFSMSDWMDRARSMATNEEETYMYELNAYTQVTEWGEDYACKQWSELYDYYYIPRWKIFIDWALDTKLRNEKFDESNQLFTILKNAVQIQFQSNISNIGNQNQRYLQGSNPRKLAKELYKKWAHMPDLKDLETD